MATNYIQEGMVYTLAVDSGTMAGDPVVVNGLPGVALTDRDSDGNSQVQLCGVFDLSAKGVNGAGNVAIAAGDDLFFVSGDTPKISKKATGVPFGVALEAVSSGSTDTINVKIARTGLPAVFTSSEQTGTASAQNVAHGLGVVPRAVLIAVTEDPGGTGFDVAEGTHTSTNVVCTVTSGVKFKVIAFA